MLQSIRDGYCIDLMNLGISTKPLIHFMKELDQLLNTNNDNEEKRE